MEINRQEGLICIDQSKLLKREMAANLDQVGDAIARKYNWRIQISGNSALNILGLSTQVPAQRIYLSDGPSKTYKIDSRTLTFKKKALKESGFKYRESSLIVQALKEIGRNAIDEEIIRKLRTVILPSQWKKILKDTMSVTSWVHEAIRRCSAGVRS